MSSPTWSQENQLAPGVAANVRRPWSRRFLASLLPHVTEGQVQFTDCWGTLSGGAEGAEPNVEVTVQDPKFYRRIVSGGVMGVAESYANGEWTCPALTDFFRLMLRNASVRTSVQRRLRGIPKLINGLRHWLKRNHREGSRKNIHQHYDLGNDFFRLFLDETLNYSSAVFDSPSQSLADASRNKMEMICRKLDLSASDHLVEIGTGWGGMAIWAAQHYGCRVTTTTISSEQFRYVSEAVKRLQLQDQVTVLPNDYRDLEGCYDKLVSVEMIEAVGHQYLPTFFQCCDRLLRPGGKMLLQAIMTSDDHYQQYLKNIDFIRAYIFPGGSLPCFGEIDRNTSNLTELKIAEREDITPHYARTLQCWLSRFEDRLQEIRKLGFDERFIRIWRYYLCYCEAGFSERHSTTEQILFVK